MGREMKWASHKKITGKIGKYFGIVDTKKLTEASILPDVEHEYRKVKVKKRGRTYVKKVYLRHHLEPFMVSKILEYTRNARMFFVRGGDYITPLGKAAHYIQDNVIDPRKKFLFWKKKDKKTHDRIESEIAKLDVPFDKVKEVRYKKFTYTDFKRTLKKTRPTGDPALAMKNATLLTAMLVKLVVSPEYPEGFYVLYAQQKKLSVMMSLVGIGLLVVGFLGWYTHVLGLHVFGWTSVFGAGVFLWGVLNPKYWTLRRDKTFLEGYKQ